MIKCVKITYKVEGETQPCFKVFNPDNKEHFVRFVPFYRYFGITTTLMQEFYGDFKNSEEELRFAWDEMDRDLAKSIVRTEGFSL